MTGDNEEWGPCIHHDGKGCPVLGEYIQAWFEGPVEHLVLREGIAGEHGAFSWDWRWFMKPSPDGDPGLVSRVVMYRVRKPRALRQLRDMVESMPVTVELREPW